MALQTGANLVIAYKEEATYGTLPTNDSSAKQLPRVKFGLAMQRSTLRSKAIRRDAQRSAARGGPRSVAGPFDDELRLGVYSDFIAAALRRAWTTVPSLSALTTVTASASAPHFVRAAGSWITDGLRVGMTIRMSGWTTTGTGNNSKNFTILALTATNITVAETVAAKAAGDSVVVSIPGKVTYAPLTGHTNKSFAFEQWAPDSGVGESRRFTGVRVGGISLDFPPGEAVAMSIDLMGQNRTKATTQYFSAATAASAAQMQTSLSGALWVNGTAMDLLTAMNIKQSNGLTTQNVAFSNITPDVFQGSIDVGGSLGILWRDGTYDDLFDNDTAVPIVMQVRDSTAAASDVMNIVLPSVKLSGGSVPDAEGAIAQSFEYVASVGDGSSGFEATTIWIQDTQAV